MAATSSSLRACSTYRESTSSMRFLRTSCPAFSSSSRRPRASSFRSRFSSFCSSLRSARCISLRRSLTSLSISCRSLRFSSLASVRSSRLRCSPSAAASRSSASDRARASLMARSSVVLRSRKPPPMPAASPATKNNTSIRRLTPYGFVKVRPFPFKRRKSGKTPPSLYPFLPIRSRGNRPGDDPGRCHFVGRKQGVGRGRGDDIARGRALGPRAMEHYGLSHRR
ncbi:MAG: hypothetical protein BWY88_00868 [Synergistetes bacterium ADurb.Bin520]|nr:MAG: hypothetical protein BWY88_00868 [Synergistetes bacterium ADurb.Bin520]